MPPSKPGDLPESNDGLLSAENGKNAIHPYHNSTLWVDSTLVGKSVAISWGTDAVAPAVTIRKWIMLTHRSMGVSFCVLFFAWFASGFVMMYCSFPRVEAEDRLAHAAVLDPGQIHLAPDRALQSRSEAPSQVRMNVLDGRPVYRFAFGRPRAALVFADTGEQPDAISQDMALRIASAWTGLASSAASSQDLVTGDQWTVYDSVHPYGPFWKYSWPNGEEVYVSRATGEVVQRTTRASRIGAYFGAIPHWLYFTRLLRNRSVWSQAVVWLSGTGTVMALLGLIAGVWLYSPSKRYRQGDGASRVPYQGQKRWHVILGLIFGLVTCTWIFSGLLSIGPFDWLSDRDLPNLQRALHGDRLDISQFAAMNPSQAIASSHLRAKELELTSFAGQAFYLVRETTHQSRLITMQADATEALETGRIIAAVKRAAAPSGLAATHLVRKYESYYLDRDNQRPLPVVYVQLDDAAQSGFYIDPKTGAVVESYGTRSRLERWLYHGLHSMDLPWLYANRPAWDVLVLTLMLGGTALSFTSLLIAGKVIRRKFSRRKRVPKDALAL
jgi:PepSY-associated TM region